VSSLIEAASFVQTLETRQGMKIACLEEIAFRRGLIDRDALMALAKPLEKSGYGKYLTEIAGLSDDKEAVGDDEGNQIVTPANSVSKLMISFC
jgi:hypothetical protein